MLTRSHSRIWPFGKKAGAGPDSRPEVPIDPGSIAQQLHQERLSRAILFDTGAGRGRAEPLFEHLLVVGLEPPPAGDAAAPAAPAAAATAEPQGTPARPQAVAGQLDAQRKHTPHVLFQYPETKTSVTGLPAFCFPEGVPVKAIGTDTEMLEVLFSTRACMKAEWSFVFVMTTDSAVPKYGICVWRLEPVNWPVMLDWDTLPSSTVNELLQRCAVNEVGEYLVAPRCYCFLSSYAFYSLFFAVLRDLLSYDYLGMKAVPQPPSDRARRHGLQLLLESLRCLPVPRPGHRVEVVVAPQLGVPHVFARPHSCEVDEMGAVWGAGALVGAVSSSALVLLLSCLLQETKLLFVSPSMRLLSRVICALVPLVRPFEWCSVMIPILPASLRDILDAPVPFIVGATWASAEPPQIAHREVRETCCCITIAALTHVTRWYAQQTPHTPRHSDVRYI
eukprot:TRINITY_DN2579_c0_g1_i1.p1 TRINITY_DN2579_c0_g1~~TRINITY_DN2579_c0_g1_i1.p1  ORF type:complete len:448 (+),score=94.14 TRINITY_DN2579_c0_g1_i1:83-1426(+)